MATVLSCTYEAGALQAMAFGVPQTKHFRIHFNYWVGDALHEGEFLSEKAIPQGSLFPVAYDPDAPHEHELAGAPTSGRSPLLMVGIVGSIVLSVIWALVLHGCQ